MPYMAQALGIRIAKDGDISYENDDAAKGDKLLLTIVRAISAPGFNVNHIRSAADPKDFLDTFAAGAVLGSGRATSAGTPGAKPASAASGEQPAKAGNATNTSMTLALHRQHKLHAVNAPPHT